VTTENFIDIRYSSAWMKSPAPIALFVYKRASHTRRTIESLLRNPAAAQSAISVYCDGPRGDAEAGAVREARAVVRELLPRARIVESERNRGLANSVIAGVSEVLAEHGRVIMFEDDLDLSPVTLDYLNDALDRYRDEDRVMHVSSYMYPVKAALPEAFFYREATCSGGWATWSRAWKHFEPDGAKIRDAVLARNARHAFDGGGRIDFFGMLENQIAGRTDSWAIRWYGSLWMRGGLGLHPGRSLVRNTGFDGSGVNSATSAAWDVEPRKERITKFPALIEEDPAAVRAVRAWRRRAGWQVRIESAQQALRRWIG
jgi:hypothetical protein